MLYHPLSEMEATQQQELPASIIQGSEQAVNRKEILVYSVNL